VAREFFKFGPLIVNVQNTGQPNMLRVAVLGEGEEFKTVIPWESTDWRRLAYEVLFELSEASEHPRRFLAKRRIAAERSSEYAGVREHMMGLASRAIDFSKAMQRLLARALRSQNAELAIRTGRA
jgi:hypothetical protein